MAMCEFFNRFYGTAPISGWISCINFAKVRVDVLEYDMYWLHMGKKLDAGYQIADCLVAIFRYIYYSVCTNSGCA